MFNLLLRPALLIRMLNGTTINFEQWPIMILYYDHYTNNYSN